ncbi:putative iron-regulated membrane protein [Wenyingzhuangia heitensis]|uniref:Iron-regulated membrane protein n=1 Tax=Wenyingzhuangia heitensis TaxID=1487859 RepID=A0ABX0U9V9_9FLAO|nr:PepSY domain-containing protein [Wenyingzhuangia heitensis]NIJ45614.1 putative iron-regulated membrane protein [Wenyingzhuangia heitensis]
MDQRKHNILFHTHTVSGIIISVVLYIIFFAGSFSFFRDDIINWERNQSPSTSENITINLNKAIDSIQANKNLYGSDLTLVKSSSQRRINVSISASKDTLVSKKENTRAFYYLDTKDFSKHQYIESYSLGEFLYRLHFLAQIKYPIGYYLAGFTAFFFLFAIITGVLVHWKKIVSNFYVFRPMAKLKALWTDAHTALGMIGLPFQFVYAVTGAFFMIKAVLIAPNIMVLYNGDKQQLFKDLGYTPTDYQLDQQKLNKTINYNAYLKEVTANWPNFKVTKVLIQNYGDTNEHLTFEGHDNLKLKFNGFGKRTYKVDTHKIIAQKQPTQTTSYVESVKNILFRIHYGDYGGYLLKIISFLLGLTSCFVIISGVMIWLVARDKKNVPEKRKRFNHRVVVIYLAICLSMYPITALSFIAVKVFAIQVSQTFIYSFYFIGWLLFSIFFILKKDIYFINNWTLKLGSYLGLCIPIANGIVTGNWLWITLLNQQYHLFFVDAFWITLSSLTLWISYKIKK